MRKGGAERLVIDIVSELKKRDNVFVKLVLFRDEIEYDIEEIKTHIHVIPSTFSLSILHKSSCNTNALQFFINTFQPNIIHTHLFEAEIVSRQCDYSGAKWFTHCHDNMVQFKNLSLSTFLSKSAFTNQVEKRALFSRYKTNGGTHFIAISADTKSYFEVNAYPFHTTLIHNAINFVRFYRPKEFSEDKIELSLINVGSLVDKKNQTFLLDVVKFLKEKDIRVHLHLLGGGINQNSLAEKIKSLDIEKQVSMLGMVENVEAYLWIADFYVHSAIYEPLGLVLIEAMAAGLPVVTLDGIGNRDLIEDDKNGQMVFEKNVPIFAAKIIEIWNDKARYKKMSVYAQQYAKRFDIKTYVGHLLKIYNAQNEP